MRVTWNIFLFCVAVALLVFGFQRSVVKSKQASSVESQPDEQASSTDLKIGPVAFQPPELPRKFIEPVYTTGCYEHHECRALNKPSVTYPPEAVENQFVGQCNVSFLVGKDGLATEIIAECSNEVFEESAMNGVLSMQFEVTNHCGKPCGYTTNRTVLPFVYKLDD